MWNSHLGPKQQNRVDGTLRGLFQKAIWYNIGMELSKKILKRYSKNELIEIILIQAKNAKMQAEQIKVQANQIKVLEERIARLEKDSETSAKPPNEDQNKPKRTKPNPNRPNQAKANPNKNHAQIKPNQTKPL